MFFSITIIVAASIGLGTGLIGGGSLGFAIASRRRAEREADEEYNRIVEYYTPPRPQYETENRSVFSRL